MPTRAELLHDTRFQRVTAAILAGAVGRSAVDLYADLEELRGLKVWVWTYRYPSMPFAYYLPPHCTPGALAWGSSGLREAGDNSRVCAFDHALA